MFLLDRSGGPGPQLSFVWLQLSPCGGDGERVLSVIVSQRMCGSVTCNHPGSLAESWVAFLVVARPEIRNKDSTVTPKSVAVASLRLGPYAGAFQPFLSRVTVSPPSGKTPTELSQFTTQRALGKLPRNMIK